MLSVSNWLDDSGVDAAGLFTAVYPLAQKLQQYGVGVDVIANKHSESHGLWGGACLNSIDIYSSLEKNLSSRINHTHGLWGTHAIASMVNASVNNSPLIISPHGMLDKWALSQSRYKKKLAKLIYETRAFNKSRYIHALTTQEADEVLLNFPKVERVEVIPNGVDIPKEYTNTKVLDDTINITFLARLHKKKGILELIEAWRLFQGSPSSNRVSLTIAGWGDESLQMKLKNSSIKNLNFIGAVYGEAKERLLRHTHFMILPSYSEGLPMSILEAWSYGIPTIMTNACNLPEGFQFDAAFKVQPDVQSILKALDIVTYIDNQSYKEMSANSYSLALDKYSWESVAKQHLELYKEL